MKVYLLLVMVLIICASASAQEQPNSAAFHAQHNPNSPYYVGGQVRQAPVAPPEWWEDRWGAIASDGKGIFGIVSVEKSERKARKGAEQECKKRGGEACAIIATYSNQCAAIVASDAEAYRGYSASEDGAIDEAQKRCDAGNGNDCHVFYSGCSLPVRVK